MPGPAEEAFLPSLPKAPRRGSLSTRHVSPQPESPVQRHCISIKLSPVLSAGTLSLPLWCLSLLVFWPFLALEDHLANPEVRPTCLLMADPPTLSRSLWAPLVVGMCVCWGGGSCLHRPSILHQNAKHPAQKSFLHGHGVRKHTTFWTWGKSEST